MSVLSCKGPLHTNTKLISVILLNVMLGSPSNLASRALRVSEISPSVASERMALSTRGRRDRSRTQAVLNWRRSDALLYLSWSKRDLLCKGKCVKHRHYPNDEDLTNSHLIFKYNKGMVSVHNLNNLWRLPAHSLGRRTHCGSLCLGQGTSLKSWGAL